MTRMVLAEDTFHEEPWPVLKPALSLSGEVG